MFFILFNNKEDNNEKFSDSRKAKLIEEKYSTPQFIGNNSRNSRVRDTTPIKKENDNEIKTYMITA